MVLPQIYNLINSSIHISSSSLYYPFITMTNKKQGKNLKSLLDYNKRAIIEAIEKVQGGAISYKINRID